MRNLLWILMIISSSAVAQRAELISTSKTMYERIVGNDQFGFTYFITNNILHKSNGVEDIQYQNLGLGKITYVDLNNPLKIVVFYADFNTVVLLDSQMNEVATRNFSTLTTPIVVSAIGNASQNRLWFYDTISQQIGLYDVYSGTSKFITQPLKGPFLYWISDLNNFQWIDQKQHRFSIDVYGKITDLGTVPIFDSILFVSNNEVIFKDAASINYYKTDGKVIPLTEIPPNSFQSLRFADQILSIFTTNAISNYKIFTTP